MDTHKLFIQFFLIMKRMARAIVDETEGFTLQCKISESSVFSLLKVLYFKIWGIQQKRMEKKNANMLSIILQSK